MVKRKNHAHTESFSGLNLGVQIWMWLSWKADWNMNLILSKTFFSSEVRTLKLRFSVGSQSLHFDGSSENILSEQVTNCPSGDKGLITHTAYRGPRPKWTGLSSSDGLCGYRHSQGLQAHRGKPSLDCLICKWNVLKSTTRRAGRFVNVLAFLKIWFLQLCFYLSEKFRKPVSDCMYWITTSVQNTYNSFNLVANKYCINKSTLKLEGETDSCF